MKAICDATAKAGLCLSGGGFRAALFHLGALRRMNDLGLLSRINTISSVSGGSILNGLLAVHWCELQKDQAGRFTNFEALIENPMRKFCSNNLRNHVLIADRLNPMNWLKLAREDYSITNKLLEAYDSDLLHAADMQILRTVLDAGGPRFVFCATSMQTGVNWEFEPKGIGDYQIGRSWKPDMKLAVAVAASSAFPLAFPPLHVSMQGGPWEFGDPGLEGIDKMRERAELTDGGVYDNMGLEPIWKSHDQVLCADGGAPFSSNIDPGDAFISRLMRVYAITDRQSRALRRRILIGAFERGEYGGTFWGISTKIGDYPLQPPANGYTGPTLAAIGTIRTDLNVFRSEEQLVLMNHGWLLAGAAIQAHCADWPWTPSAAPDPNLLDSVKALAALQNR